MLKRTQNLVSLDLVVLCLVFFLRAEKMVLRIAYTFCMGQCNLYTAFLAGFIMLVCLVLQRHCNGRKLRLPPGPPGVPVIGHLHLIGKLAHQSLTRLSNQYGPVMSLRLGSVYTVVISSPDAAREVLRTHDAIFASRPATIVAEVLLQNSDLIWSPLGECWRTLRKTCVMELFRPKVLERYKQIRSDASIKLVSDMVEESGGRTAVRLEEWMLEHMHSNITQLLFSKRYQAKNSNALSPGCLNNGVGQLVHLAEQVGAIGPVLIGAFLPALRKLDLDGKEAQLRAVSAKFNQILQGIIDERRDSRQRQDARNNETQPADFVDVLLSIQTNKDDKRTALSDRRIRAVLLDLIIAGSETSAIALSWVLAELMRNPEVGRKVHSELDLVVGTERLVEESDIPQLKYLRAVVKESFRLHPSTPLLVPHQSVAAAQVGGNYIPNKTQVYINAYAIMRDPTVWEKPLEFLPDRFLTSSAHIEASGQNFQYLPFGSGRRRCVAADFGLLLVEATLARLLHTCDFSLPEGMKPEDVNMEESFGHSMHRAKPLEVLVSPRTPWLNYTNGRLACIGRKQL